MKKKLLKITLPFTLALLVPFPALAQEQTEAERQVDASKLLDILVAFLYLAAVLALIYVILLIIDRHAKRNPQNRERKKEETGTAENQSNTEIKKEQTAYEDSEDHE